jgi:hypothetical protein
LNVTSRGSCAEYLLLARSVRTVAFLFLATTSTCAFSDSVQEMKSHAWSACLLVAVVPMTSPPMKDDLPPFRPGIGATPACRAGPSFINCNAVVPNGWMPILPSVNAWVQVGPFSDFTLAGVMPSLNILRYRV